MTKICVRLLFLAAIALPLAHGCSDGTLECLGTPVACENRELATCTDGCSVYSGCLGSTVTCESLTDRPQLCVQTGDCRFVGTCEGREGCAAVPYDACAETPGCVQVRSCIGGSVSCGDLEDSQCELHPQCRLGDECRGSADGCGELSSSTECAAVPGCYPADTKPSVVD
jgi:hypothetical protein